MKHVVRRVCVGMILMLVLSFNLPAATFGPGVLLIPVDVAANSLFGFTVAASGNLLAVGAPGNANGIVYLFQRSGDGWIPQAELTVNDGTSQFGATLAMDGNTLVVNGHVLVNNNGSWTLQATITAGNVSINRDTIAVGTSNAVYIFVKQRSLDATSHNSSQRPVVATCYRGSSERHISCWRTKYRFLVRNCLHFHAAKWLMVVASDVAAGRLGAGHILWHWRFD